jgi:uncharacterized membrane protein YgaE (UPF0421/DUF939 family)
MKPTGGRLPGVDVRERLSRLASMAPSIAQCAVAAAVAWIVAKDVLGHDRPFFAPIAAVICLGVTLGQRLRRLAELLAGVGVGIGVGDVLVPHIGSGPWQIALIVALAMGVAVFLDKGPIIAIQAGSSAVLVATLLPASGTGGLDRMIDALVGGTVGIVAIALLPADPAAIAHRHASAVLGALAEALEGIGEAVRRSDLDRAVSVLEDARGTQAVVERLREALETGREIATISPLRRRWRRRLLGYEKASAPIDHAIRNARVLVRRAIVALEDGEPIPPAFPETAFALSRAALSLRDELASGREPVKSREAVLERARHLSVAPGAPYGFSAEVMTAQLRSITVDLLLATGIGRDDALAALPQPHGTTGAGSVQARETGDGGTVDGDAGGGDGGADREAVRRTADRDPTG